MKRWKILAFMAVIGSIAAIGCSKKNVAGFTGNEPVISISKAPDKISGNYHFFVDHQTNERIMFRTKERVENFAYIEILPSVDDEDNIVLLIGDVLFGLDDFAPEKPLVVTANIGSGIPARGIFFGYRGKVWRFYITESGMDGSTLLTEFTPSSR